MIKKDILYDTDLYMQGYFFYFQTSRSITYILRRLPVGNYWFDKEEHNQKQCNRKFLPRKKVS